MNDRQKKAMVNRSNPLYVIQWREGPLYLCMNIVMTDKKPTEWSWMVSVSGNGYDKKKKQALKRALKGVGIEAEDVFTRNPVGALYLFRPLTQDEVIPKEETIANETIH